MLGRLLLLVTSPAWLALGGLAQDYFNSKCTVLQEVYRWEQ